MTDTYSATTGGVLRNGAVFIPQDEANAAWRQYQAWLAAGGTLAPEVLPSIEDARASAILELENAADARRAAIAPTSTGAATLALRIAEAESADIDVAISPGEYPLLEALIGVRGADVEEVATNVIADAATLKATWGAIDAVMEQARIDVAAAGSVAAVQTVLSNVVWP